MNLKKKFQQSAVFFLALFCTLSFTACSDDSSSGGSGGDDSVDIFEIIDISAIQGVTAPVLGETPVSAITETDQYTGTVSWSPDDDPFALGTVYTATITLTAKSGYTLTGVTEDFFTVAGASAIGNDADSGVVTAEFPATANNPWVSSFSSEIVYVEVGGGVLPGDLILSLNGPAQGDTVVDLTSSSSSVLSVPFSVTVPDGANTVAVPLTGNMSQSDPVTVTASHTVESVLHEIEATAYVYDDSSTRSLAGITPDTAEVLVNAETTFTATLNLPAPSGGSTISLTTTGGIGTVPAVVVVSAGEFGVDFTFTAAGAASAIGSIEATLGTSNANAVVDVVDL